MGTGDYRKGNNEREQKRYQKRERRFASSDPVVASDVDSHAVLDILDACVECGTAVRFGVTRDKSCWAIGVYVEGIQPYTEYVKVGEDINAYLHELAEWMRNGQGGG
jgi:hypothetical protein